MPSTNGHGPKRTILYARVSTDEQARSGYSLAQQLVHLQDRFRVVSYSKRHETSNLCTSALKRRAQTTRSAAALQRRFHLAPFPDTPGQLQGRTRPTNS